MGVEGEVKLLAGVELDLEVDIDTGELLDETKDVIDAIAKTKEYAAAQEEAEKLAKAAEEEAQRLLEEHAAEIAAAKAAAEAAAKITEEAVRKAQEELEKHEREVEEAAKDVAAEACLLYTSPSPRD